VNPDCLKLLVARASDRTVYAGSRRSGTPNRFDPSFYRTHDPLAYIPSDNQSMKSQATYSSALPTFPHLVAGSYGNGQNGGPRTNGAGSKRPPYSTTYASSVISQDLGAATTDSGSVVGAPAANIIVPSGGPSSGPHHLSYSQADRLRRRSSQSSIADVSDLGSSASALDYNSYYKNSAHMDEGTDLDDLRSQYGQSQSGFTEF
jgi:regulator of nonsense transcripts 1